MIPRTDPKIVADAGREHSNSKTIRPLNFKLSSKKASRLNRRPISRVARAKPASPSRVGRVIPLRRAAAASRVTSS